MKGNVFVIVDVSKGLYFARNQENSFTKNTKRVSWWTDEDGARKTLNKIIKKPAIKQKAGKLTVMKLKDAKEKIAQNANKLAISPTPYWKQAKHLVRLAFSISNTSSERSKRLGCVSQLNEELKRLTMDHNLDNLTVVYRHSNPNTDLFDYDADAITHFIRRFAYTYPEPITDKSEPIVNNSKLIAKEFIADNLEPIADNDSETEQAKLFNLLKFVCSIVTEIQQEELPYVQKSLCMIAAESSEIKNSISKKIRECDNKDLDFLHVIELGKFDAVEWTKLIISERENRQKRRQYKDEWSAINILFPNPEPDMEKIKTRAEKCLETIEIVETNNRKYSFRDKESKKQFGNLLK